MNLRDVAQAFPVPTVIGFDAAPLELGAIVLCVAEDPELSGLVGELIKVSKSGEFVYVRLHEKLLADSPQPEVVVTPPSLWVGKKKKESRR